MILTHGANSLGSGGGIPLPAGYHSVAADYAGLYDLVNNVFYTNQYITSLTEIPE